MVVVDVVEGSSSTTLGGALLKHRGTIHGDLRIVLAGDKNQKGDRWLLLTTSMTSASANSLTRSLHPTSQTIGIV